MLAGLMMDDAPLTLQVLLRRMRTMNRSGRVVTMRSAAGECSSTDYGELAGRIDRLAAALTALGVAPGERVATFLWNDQEHLELYYAVPCIGAVLHTLNLRLDAEQLRYIVAHAEDRVIVVDATLLGLLDAGAPEFDGVEHWIVVGDGPTDRLRGTVHDYEQLIAGADADVAYPEIADDRAAAGLCYTSGTTGDPKGVLYSHRSTVLHTLALAMVDTAGVSARHRVLPVVPMFHAMAWGLPYACTMVGADLVMPGPFLQAEPLARLIEAERVTYAAAVPTIWRDLLAYLDAHPAVDVSSLRSVLVGGSALPRPLLDAYEDRHDMTLFAGWGMTETSPLGATAMPLEEDVEPETDRALRARQGRFVPLVEGRIADDDGVELPWDDEATGELHVRGPWIARAYYRDGGAGADRFTADGWLRTGDIAAIDPTGSVRLTDRAKDVVKSGGEWISTVELENELMGHPAVAEAAVIARPDERWTERPLACVVLSEGAEVTAAELALHLRGRVLKWWVPEDYVVIDEVPKTSVGKFDKRALRARLAAGELGETQTVDVHALFDER